MPKYRQVLNNETGKYELIEVGAAVTRSSYAIHGDIDAFKSVVDGSVISDRKQLREHNLRNDVVQTADLGGVSPNVRTKAGWSHEVKQAIYERINQLERQQ